MARRKGCLAGLLFIAILIAAALLLAPVMPLGWLKPRVESRLSATLGRQVTIDSLRVNLFGGPYLTIRGLTAKEDPAFGDGNLLKADEVRADFSLTDYALRRQLVIEAMTLRSPEFTFVKNPNGAWSWTTLGNSANVAEATLKHSLIDAGLALLADVDEARLRHVTIDAASVRLVDKTGAEPPESLYKNVALTADIAADPGNSSGRHATGTLRVASNESDGAETLKTEMPFDLTIAPSVGLGTTIKGSFGPGAFESKNFSAGQFKVDGEFLSERASNTSGKGHISATAIQIPTVNVSERVAGAARVNQLGEDRPARNRFQLCRRCGEHHKPATGGARRAGRCDCRDGLVQDEARINAELRRDRDPVARIDRAVENIGESVDRGGGRCARRPQRPGGAFEHHR